MLKYIIFWMVVAAFTPLTPIGGLIIGYFHYKLEQKKANAQYRQNLSIFIERFF